MTSHFIEMTEEEFDTRYSLRPNHLDPDATWAFDDDRGCLFATSGEELTFVRQQPPGTIWTLVDDDDGNLLLVSGYHFVNRIGYLISTTAVPDGTVIQVRIDVSDEQTSDDNKEV